MKIVTLLLFFAVLNISRTHAQHCPFDGSSMIVVYLSDKDGSPVESPAGLLLKEKTNPLADSCSYAKGHLVIPFAHAKDSLFLKHNGGWKRQSVERSEGCPFLEPGYFVVVLNMAQTSCMIKKNNDYKYLPRLFAIEANGISTDVPEESIYPLCTTAGSWQRIRTIAVLTKN